MKKFGALGTFSRGSMGAGDEGDLQMGIAHTKSEVVIRFGKAVAWLGLEPDKAEEFAKIILEHAQAIRKSAQ